MGKASLAKKRPAAHPEGLGPPGRRRSAEVETVLSHVPVERFKRGPSRRCQRDIPIRPDEVDGVPRKPRLSDGGSEGKPMQGQAELIAGLRPCLGRLAIDVGLPIHGT